MLSSLKLAVAVAAVAAAELAEPAGGAVAAEPAVVVAVAVKAELAMEELETVEAFAEASVPTPTYSFVLEEASFVEQSVKVVAYQLFVQEAVELVAFD